MIHTRVGTLFILFSYTRSLVSFKEAPVIL